MNRRTKPSNAGPVTGLFRTINPHIAEEKHGGVTLQTEVYWFLAFYGETNFVGLYGSHKNSYENYYLMTFKQTGQITSIKDNCIVLSIRSPFNNDQIIFEGVFITGSNKLQLRARNGSTDEAVWPDETYERIELPIPA